MADVKVSALTALTGADLANGDQFLVTDVGSPNVSKSITADELAQGSQFTSRYRASAPTFTSWTPTVTSTGGSITSYTIAAFDYLVEGKIGHFHGRISITNAGTGSGILSVTLPSGVTLAGYDSSFWIGGYYEGNTGTFGSVIRLSNTEFGIMKNDGSTVIATNASIRFQAMARVA
jgi:hypothetical protein